MVRLVRSRDVCVDSAYQWRPVVTDGLTTDDVDVTMMCHIIIVAL